jgi:hypothetical protein
MIRLSMEGGFWLGLRSRYNANVARFFFKGICNTWQEKSELPKNYESCPINQPKTLVIGQSPKKLLTDKHFWWFFSRISTHP